MPRSAALVTDSTSLDASLADRLGAVVVPLKVVIGATSYDEGGDATSAHVVEALKRHIPISTSRPAPGAFLRAYEAASRCGAEAVVSVHLSSEVSGTYESAELAARDASLPVHLVDSRQLGMGTGFALQSAAQTLDAGGSAAEAADVARDRAEATTVLFYVDTLEYLRRGGRVGVTAALLGSALAVKPLLHVADGRIEPLERVRTSARAVARLEARAVMAAADVDFDVAVSHLDNAARADDLASRLRDRLPHLEDLVVNEAGAVIGAHVGPGMLAVVVSPRSTRAQLG
ncbi:MAG: DegV family protein [Nocardioidaceae bacterium]